MRCRFEWRREMEMFRNTFRLTQAISLLVGMGHLVVRSAAPARQLEDFGSRTKQSARTYRKTTRHPTNGAREVSRRLRQIEAGTLQVSR